MTEACWVPPAVPDAAPLTAVPAGGAALAMTIFWVTGAGALPMAFSRSAALGSGWVVSAGWAATAGAAGVAAVVVGTIVVVGAGAAGVAGCEAPACEVGTGGVRTGDVVT